MWLLLLTHAAALAAFWWLPGWAARRDATAFRADGSNDSKHYTFHRQRLTERVGGALALALLASLPLFGMWHAYVASCAGLLSAAGGIWAFRFNRLLNVARALPYVGPDYVSPDPRAAWFPDRWIWQRAVAAVPPGPWNDAELHQNRAAYAAALLRRTLREVLLAGGLLYLLTLAALIWLRVPAAG